MISMDDYLYTINEVADRLRVSTMTIRRWIKAGKIAVVRLPVSNSPRITQDEVNRLVTPTIENIERA
jgi:excisionase family DNA binding protein